MTRPAHRQGVHRKARNEQNAVTAYDLWIDGANYAEISRQLDCDPSTARDRVLRATTMLRGDVTDKRDRVTNEHFEDAVALGKIAASDMVEVKDRVAAYNARRGHLERIAKLNGLDEPIKTDVTSDGQAVTVVFNPSLTPKPQQ